MTTKIQDLFKIVRSMLHSNCLLNNVKVIFLQQQYQKSLLCSTKSVTTLKGKNCEKKRENSHSEIAKAYHMMVECYRTIISAPKMPHNF